MKLLANQQEDGDGLLQNIVTNLGMGSRKGLTDGLREFTKVDTERALDVGELLRGTGKVSGSEAESSGRGLGCNNQGEDELTLRGKMEPSFG